jgi:hypothetical protein
MKKANKLLTNPKILEGLNQLGTIVEDLYQSTSANSDVWEVIGEIKGKLAEAQDLVKPKTREDLLNDVEDIYIELHNTITHGGDFNEILEKVKGILYREGIDV